MKMFQGSAIFKSAFLFTKKRKNLPQTLIFFVTSRCNARCDFCLYRDAVHNPVKQAEELSLFEIEQFAKNYGPLHYLALSGGEPFLRGDIQALCQVFIDRCGVSVIDIPSNFYYMESMLSSIEPLVRNNPQVIVDLQFSVDHLGARHDESRKVKGIFQKGLETFKALEKVRTNNQNLKLKINLVYLESNKDEMDTIREFLSRELRYDRIQISYTNKYLPINCQPDPKILTDYKDFYAKAESFTEQTMCEKVCDPYVLGMRATKRIYHRIMGNAVSGREPLSALCEAGRNIVVLNEKGDVFPCEILWKKIGNIRNMQYDLRKVLSGPAYQSFRDQYIGTNKCNCTWGCAALSTVSVTPKYLPEVAINAVKILLSELKSKAGFCIK
jgi:radical SAM protein with 4Fe4S-binding SPASM domain